VITEIISHFMYVEVIASQRCKDSVVVLLLQNLYLESQQLSPT